MKKGFYSSLAANNLIKNRRIYLPFILASSGCALMFYLMMFLSTNEYTMREDSLKTLLAFGCIIIGIFTLIFLFYTNSFIIKRRKNEIGLYNILGMEKRHIGRVLALETLYVSIISITAGILLGILFSALALMLLAKMLRFNIGMTFSVSSLSIGATITLFAVIFTIILLYNLIQIRLSKPVELLHGDKVGEKEPKTKWLIALIGVICLGFGYYIALTVKNPIDTIGLFFVAVLLVIIGTFCLFTACSIAVLKLMRKNKSYYYQTSHFTSVSGMIYRMKQNAAGLASICILSTMVLVMLSTTSSLFIGFDDTLRNQYPRNVEINASPFCGEDDQRRLLEIANKKCSEYETSPESVINYRSTSFSMIHAENKYGFNTTGGDVYTGDCNELVYFLPVCEYNKMHGTDVVLGKNEVMYYSKNMKMTDKKVIFGSTEFAVKEVLSALNVEESFSARYVNVSYFIMPDENTIESIYNELTNTEGNFRGLRLYIGFDDDLSDEKEIELSEAIAAEAATDDNIGVAFYTMCAADAKETYLSVYGGLFFLGIFLGGLFTMATALIIYYKQVSEGYDDKERFCIMQKVGMSREEIKKTIHSQVITVFFLPLGMAVVHIGFAFKMITKMLALLNLTNVGLFAICTIVTIAAFAVLYSVVYALTARTYYKIVK